jgi:hypothetical protein
MHWRRVRRYPVFVLSIGPLPHIQRPKYDIQPELYRPDADEPDNEHEDVCDVVTDSHFPVQFNFFQSPGGEPCKVNQGKKVCPRNHSKRKKVPITTAMKNTPKTSQCVALTISSINLFMILNTRYSPKVCNPCTLNPEPV